MRLYCFSTLTAEPGFAHLVREGRYREIIEIRRSDGQISVDVASTKDAGLEDLEIEISDEQIHIAMFFAKKIRTDYFIDRHTGAFWGEFRNTEGQRDATSSGVCARDSS